MSASRVTTWPIMVIPGTFVRRCPLPPHPSLRSSTPPHRPLIYMLVPRKARRLYMFAALTKPVAPGLYTLRLAPSPPHLIYMRFAWPHPEGITPECRSVGEVELRFRGTIRPERPHTLSDPPRASPTLRCPLAPPSPLIFIRFARPRCAPPHHPSPSPLIFIRFARPRCAPPHHPSPSPPLFLCSLRSQGPNFYFRSSQRPIAPDVSTLRLGRAPASTYGRPYGTTSGRRRAVVRSGEGFVVRRGGFPRLTGLDARGGSPSGGALSTCGPDVRGFARNEHINNGAMVWGGVARRSVHRAVPVSGTRRRFRLCVFASVVTPLG